MKILRPTVEFTTYSSAIYTLTGITREGSFWTAQLDRSSKEGVYNAQTGERIEVDTAKVKFLDLPKVGRGFDYIHPELDTCLSSQVVQINVTEKIEELDMNSYSVEITHEKTVNMLGG